MTPTELRTLRKAAQLSQRELAVMLGLTGKAPWETVSRWERGQRKLDGPTAMAIMCALTHVSAKQTGT